MEIKDLSGRHILKGEVKVSDFIGTLDLSLINGVYIVTISNRNNETLSKKLLITK